MVYVVTDGSGFVKIGVAKQLKDRIISLQTGNPRKINVLFTFETDSLKNDRKLEKILHMEFYKERLIFENGSESEWFNESVLQVINTHKAKFCDYIQIKYGIQSEIKLHVEPEEFKEERRLEKLKTVMRGFDVCGECTKKEIEDDKQENIPEQAIDKKPRFNVGDAVKLRDDLKSDRLYGGFGIGNGIPTGIAKIIYVHDDCPACNFYYGLDNGTAYSEEMLEAYRYWE